jgi:hypothetical protein
VINYRTRVTGSRVRTRSWKGQSISAPDALTSDEPRTPSAPRRRRPRRRNVVIAVVLVAVLAITGWFGYRLTHIDISGGAYRVSSCLDTSSHNPDGATEVTQFGVMYGLGVFTLHSPSRITFRGVAPTKRDGSITVDRAFLVPGGGNVGSESAASMTKAGLTATQQRLEVTPGQAIYTMPAQDRDRENRSGNNWQLVIVLKTANPSGLNSIDGFTISFSAPWHLGRSITVQDPVTFDGRPGIACSRDWKN